MNVLFTKRGPLKTWDSRTVLFVFKLLFAVQGVGVGVSNPCTSQVRLSMHSAVWQARFPGSPGSSTLSISGPRPVKRSTKAGKEMSFQHVCWMFGHVDSDIDVWTCFSRTIIPSQLCVVRWTTFVPTRASWASTLTASWWPACGLHSQKMPEASVPEAVSCQRNEASQCRFRHGNWCCVSLPLFVNYVNCLRAESASSTLLPVPEFLWVFLKSVLELLQRT